MDDDTLSDELTTIAEAVSEQGYRTGALLKSPVISADRGFAQGFDDFHVLGGAQAHGRSGEELVQSAARWLLNHANRPRHSFCTCTSWTPTFHIKRQLRNRCPITMVHFMAQHQTSIQFKPATIPQPSKI